MLREESFLGAERCFVFGVKVFMAVLCQPTTALAGLVQGLLVLDGIPVDSNQESLEDLGPEEYVRIYR